MPVITLSWHDYYKPISEQYGTNNWIMYLNWRDNITHSPLPWSITGVYVITNNGRPVYAGSSKEIRRRFDERNRVLNEYGMDPAIVVPDQQYKLYIASSNPASQFKQAEKWLVRQLTINDTRTAPRMLQNVHFTNNYTAPVDGLTIYNSNNPPFLNYSYRLNGGQQI